MDTETKVFDALKAFINAKPELECADYGCDPKQAEYTSRKEWWNNMRNMHAELRSIQRDGTRARKALLEALKYPFNAAVLAEAFGRAFGGRLSWGGSELEYTTGQYYPTEYRKAAASVLEYYVSQVKPKFVPPTGKVYYTTHEIERDADNAGSHFFDKDTKRFFRSRILLDAFHGKGGCYFVTSEQQHSLYSSTTSKRCYTIRKFNPETCDISTFGPFNSLGRSTALRLARIASEYPEAALEALGCV